MRENLARVWYTRDLVHWHVGQTTWQGRAHISHLVTFVAVHVSYGSPLLQFGFVYCIDSINRGEGQPSQKPH